MGVGLTLDISKLQACFGGFSPTDLGNGYATQERLAEAERVARERRESLDRAAAIEAARASDPFEITDENGSYWRYVLLDGAEVRIERCEPAVPQLVIPETIDGYPVVAVSPDAFSYLPDLEEVVCPNSLVHMGFCAFRGCKNLRAAYLPETLAEFDSDWFRLCPKLTVLQLPGRLTRLDSSIFDIPNLRHLIVGAEALDVAPGAFGKSKLTTIEVVEGSRFLETDGKALYSKDGEIFVALVIPSEEYEVRAGCRALAKKAMSNFSCLKRVVLPDSVEVLAEYAFTNTGIEVFEGPANLKSIGERAFFNCRSLKRVTLKEGLLVVGQNAFTGTKLEALKLPSTLEELGYPVADRVGLTYAGAEATFSIVEGSEHLRLTEDGSLYRIDGDELKLVRMLDPTATSCVVQEGTTVIAEDAFYNHRSIVRVQLPEGLKEIKEAAFKDCRDLVDVNVPESVERIEAEAFLNTSIESMYLPSGLTHLGINALVTYGARHDFANPSLKSIVVGEGNELLYTDEGLLFEHKKNGKKRIVLCVANTEVIRIPDDVDELAPYAFNNVKNVRELFISDRIRSIGIRGLAIDSAVELIHIDLEKPIEGHDYLDIRYPATKRATHQLMLALGVHEFLNVQAILENYDSAIINTGSFTTEGDEAMGVYEKTTRILERLLDPVYMSEVNKEMCDLFLRTNIERISLEIAKHDDRRAIDALVELGYLNADNLNGVIDRIGAIQDAAMTGYLLELKRERFGQDAFDFDL